MSAVAETLAIFVGLDSLTLPVLIGINKVKTPQGTRLRQTTAGAVTATEPAASAGKPTEPEQQQLELAAVGSGLRARGTGQFVDNGGRRARKKQQQGTAA